MLRFASTRDPGRAPVDFDRALLSGLAPDGGLYVPTSTPELPEGWDEAVGLPDLAERVLGAWLGDGRPRGDERGDDGSRDVEAAEVASRAHGDGGVRGPASGHRTLGDLLRDALSFPVPVVPLGGDRWVLEVFHGPTLSFKDVGARTMARLTSRALQGSDERLTVLVATSGDTGSAVADGFAGQGAIDVILLYPAGMVSDVQERQLTAPRPGVRAFAVEGTFDDCQRLVKEAFVDPELAHAHLTSANSINIGRLLPQSLYYLWAAIQLREQGVDPDDVVFCVPSGNLGNLTAGVLAHLAGMPAAGFVAAHNRNAFFPQFLEGRREGYDFLPTLRTPSNAMDVGAPSNFERLHHLLGDAVRERIWGTSVDDGTTLARIRAEAAAGYLACPHTAVGLEGAERYRSHTGHTGPIVTLATAHPAKFPDVLERALGRAAPRSPRLDALTDSDASVEPLAPDLDALRSVLR